MKLGDWIERERLTLEAFGRRINRNYTAVARYIRGERLPGRKTYIDIYVETRGEVTPNDFYDLPELTSSPQNVLAGDQPSVVLR
jgi:hypothetical protein